MTEADTNGNGVIDLDEFVAWLTKPPVSSQGSALYNYGDVFMPLFKLYESDNSGVITKDSFEEIHCIMQGALRLNPSDESESHADPLDLAKDHDEAFAEADKTGDGKITFRAFVDWMREHIPPGMDKDDLRKFVSGLSAAMAGAHRVIKMAETGQIGDDEDGAELLQGFLAKLATSTRTFAEATSGKGGATGENHWSEPPVGLNVEKLRALHMKLNPLNVRMVETSVWEVLVLPLLGVDKESGKRTWCGEVVRRITYKSGKLKVEQPSYYVFMPANYSWVETCQVEGTEKFDNALKSLAPELGLFCLLKTEANFGIQLAWPGILNALEGGVDMGLITQEQYDSYESAMKSGAKDNLKESGHLAHQDTAAEIDKSIQDFLATVSLRPRVVMATLSELGIVKIRPEWADFVNSN
jgi:Ca2+-binding EF-hand superfamily protein